VCIRVHLWFRRLDPLLILDRGYAIVTGQSGAIVKDSTAVPPRSAIRVRLAKGRLNATVSNTLEPQMDTDKHG
jgi:exodeoxyribonuclease VII large subunit